MLAAIAWRCRRLAIPLVAHDQGRRTVGGLEAWAWRHSLPQVSAFVVSTTEATDQLDRAGTPQNQCTSSPTGSTPGSSIRVRGGLTHLSRFESSSSLG